MGIGDLGVERECRRCDSLHERFDPIGPDDGRKPLLGALPVGPGPQELRLARAGDREHAAAPIRSLRLLDPPVLQQKFQRPGERRRIHPEAAGDVRLGDPRDAANGCQQTELADLHPCRPHLIVVKPCGQSPEAPHVGADAGERHPRWLRQLEA